MIILVNFTKNFISYFKILLFHKKNVKTFNCTNNSIEVILNFTNKSFYREKRERERGAIVLMS